MLPPSVCHLFARQYGVAAPWQLDHLSATERRSVMRHPDVRRLTPRVLEHAVAPALPEHGLLSAVLDGGEGAALWGKSATTFLGVGRFRNRPVHVGRPRTRLRGDRLGQMHMSRHLEPSDIVVHREIPTVRPEFAAMWLAGMWTHRSDVARAATWTGRVIDQAWRQGLVDDRYLRTLVDRWAGRGNSGVVAMRLVLDERPPGYQPSGSGLERRFEELVPDEIRDRLRRQTSHDIDRIQHVVDYELATWPLVIEINGETWHTSVTDRRRDEDRYRRLLAAGFSVLVLWEYDVWHDSRVVTAAVTKTVTRPDSTPTIHRPTPPPWQFW